MKSKVRINIFSDKFKKNFFFISIYKKYNYKQYIINHDLLYTFFLIIHFLYKYGFIIIKK